MGGAAMSNVERLESRLKAGDVIKNGTRRAKGKEKHKK
jgi:hypothetical protein